MIKSIPVTIPLDSTKLLVEQHHYFATTAFHYGRGKTRQEAVENVARRAGKDIIKLQVKGQGGLYCWTAKVALAFDAEYAIEYYRPVVGAGELTDGQEFYIVDARGFVKVGG